MGSVEVSQGRNKAHLFRFMALAQIYFDPTDGLVESHGRGDDGIFRALAAITSWYF